MKLRTTFLAVALTAVATFATADHLKGVVVRLEPGKLMVVRGPDMKEVTYNFGPTLTLPADVAVGRTVEFDTERGTTGDTWVVTRVTTTTMPDGSMERVTERTVTPAGEESYTTVSGEVVSFEPGRTLVLRDASRKTVTYTLTPELTVPADVRIGRQVTVFTEPGTAGTTMVRRVTLTTTPEGDVKRTTTETHTHPSGAMHTTTTTSIDGVVETYVAGKSLTLTRPDGTRVTYIVNERSNIPADLAVGKRVFIRTVPVTGSNDLAVERVSYTTTKTKTKDGETVTKSKTKVKEETDPDN